MNTMTLNHALLAGITALTLVAADAAPQTASGGRLRGRTLSTAGDGQSSYAVSTTGSQSVQVSVQGDKITARVNGEEVPPDRIRVEGGRVIILDENGEPLEGMRLGVAGDGPMIHLFGDSAAVGTAAQPLPVMMGITMSATSRALEKHLRLDEDASTMITGVYEGLPAYEAGLRQYDIIVEIDGHAPAGPAGIREHLRAKSPGDTVRLEVIQEGKRRQVRVELMENDPAVLAEAEYTGSGMARTRADELFPKIWGQFGDQDQWRDIVVTPDADVFRRLPRFDVPRDLERALKDAMEGEGGQIDTRLESLDERMAELEAMLNALLERLERRGGER